MDANTFSNKAKNILIVGTLGIGKSTVMNRLAGEEQFKAGNNASGVTQVVSSYEFEKDGCRYKVWDTPGLNDTEMDISTWIANFKKTAKANQEPIHMIIVAFKSNWRPSNEQKTDIITAMEVIKNVSSDHLGFLFTYSDAVDLRETNDDGHVAY